MFAYSSLQREKVPPVLLSASVSDNSGNSPQMAAPRRLREIDQSAQILGRTFMILILTNQAVFVTLSVVKIPPLAQPSLF